MAAVTLVDLRGNIGQSHATDVSRSIQFSLISLPQPGDGGHNEETARINSPTAPMGEYMLVSPKKHSSTDIFEIQSVLPHSGKYASYFVGSRIISNPSLHVTTRVDPLFFALAHFHRISTVASKEKGVGASPNNTKENPLQKWQPWDQALADLPPVILRALDLDPGLNIDGINGVGQLGHLLDVSDMCGDDLILCKFSEERTLKWLESKFDRSLEALRTRFLGKKKWAIQRKKDAASNGTGGGTGAFSSSFNVVDGNCNVGKEINAKGECVVVDDESKENALTKDEENFACVSALQLICEYLPTEWAEKLSKVIIKKVGMAEEDWMPKKKVSQASTSVTPTGNGHNESPTITTGQKRSRPSWEGNIGQEDADALMHYTVGGSGGGASVISPGEKNGVKNAKSVGLKKLAKVNTKGMKSMASFFGAGKKKK